MTDYDIDIYRLERSVMDLEQKIDDLLARIVELEGQLADERQRRRVLSSRVDYQGLRS